MADRGFTCDEYTRLVLAEVKTPPFTRGENQLEKIDVDWSRELSLVRINAKTVIGVLKQNYTTLQGVLPIAVVAGMDGSYVTIDKIVRACCVLNKFMSIGCTTTLTVVIIICYKHHRVVVIKDCPLVATSRLMISISSDVTHVK